MFLSSVNIFSDSCAALIIAKSEGNSGFFIKKKNQKRSDYNLLHFFSLVFLPKNTANKRLSTVGR